MVNTAILTGRRVAVPIKVVSVGADGQVREVDDAVTCSSTDVDVVKVRERTRAKSLMVIFRFFYFFFNNLSSELDFDPKGHMIVWLFISPAVCTQLIPDMSVTVNWGCFTSRLFGT